MRKLLPTALAGVILAASAMAPAYAQAPQAPAAAAGKLSSDSTMGVLLANEKSRPILEKYIPIIVQYADMIPNVQVTTLKQLMDNPQATSAGGLTPEALKSIEDDLAKL